MPQYRLVAMRGDENAEYEFAADDRFDATTTAISYVLDRAMESRLWAKGRIELWRGKKVLHVMEAKEE